MRATLLAHLLLDAGIDVACGLLISRYRILLLLRRRHLHLRLVRRRWRNRSRVRNMILLGAFLVGTLLCLAGFAFALFTTLLGFYNVLAQFAVIAEETAISNDKFRFLLFFWHKFYSVKTRKAGCALWRSARRFEPLFPAQQLHAADNLRLRCDRLEGAWRW